MSSGVIALRASAAAEAPSQSHVDFLREIVPRMIDAGFALDVACLANTCKAAREIPRVNGHPDTQHWLLYRAARAARDGDGKDFVS